MNTQDEYLIYEKARQDPMVFLSMIRTYDPDEPNPKKRIKWFPIEKPHVQFLVDEWQNQIKMIIKKSRQMQITWLFVALYLHQAITKADEFIFFKSEMLEHAAEIKNKLSLLGRAWFMINLLPKPFLWYCWEKKVEIPSPTGGNKPLWVLPNGSTIKPVSQNPDVVRQFTASGCLDDESAHQPWAEEGFTALDPALGTYGRHTIVSSICGKNWFYRKHNDDE